MSRSTEAQKAERLNAALGLLAGGQSVAEAAVSLSRRFAMSRRQAYRYIEKAQMIGRPVVVAEPTAAVTFKLLLANIYLHYVFERATPRRRPISRALTPSW